MLKTLQVVQGPLRRKIAFGSHELAHHAVEHQCEDTNAGMRLDALGGLPLTRVGD